VSGGDAEQSAPMKELREHNEVRIINI